MKSPWSKTQKYSKIREIIEDYKIQLPLMSSQEITDVENDLSLFAGLENVSPLFKGFKVRYRVFQSMASK